MEVIVIVAEPFDVLIVTVIVITFDLMEQVYNQRTFLTLNTLKRVKLILI